jgi:ElaB/YqjD/DUF883 family membrane-anchored ribosome-binding protein
MASDHTNVGEASHANPSRTERLEDKTQEAAAEFRDRANQTREQVREHAEALSAQAKEVAAEYCRQGRAIAGEWQRVLEEQIREKPIQSLLVAGGIGVLVGLLWRR